MVRGCISVLHTVINRRGKCKSAPGRPCSRRLSLLAPFGEVELGQSVSLFIHRAHKKAVDVLNGLRTALNITRV
jgi:hypothetical protein